MSISPRLRREPSSSPSPRSPRLGAAGGILVLLLAAFPLIVMLPNEVASIRLAGLSLLWWYGGVLAPLAAAATTALLAAGPAGEIPASSVPPATGASSAPPPDRP